ncbi:MAG: hypothetical protein P4L53_05640 [Candidatus Obscuribacterales bacterium]|nr:hypothetical protein [Candidatus Obscuribacterales bacterium]
MASVKRKGLQIQSLLCLVGMVHLLLCFECLPSFAANTQSVVFEQNGELWLKLANGEHQVTEDGTKKGVWALSEDDKKVAYTVSPEEEFTRTNTVIIADTFGHRLHRYTLKKVGARERFAKATKIEWIDDRRVGVEYMVTAQCNQYIIIDTSSGEMLGNHLGFLFSWSPDTKQIAYVGWDENAPVREQQHSYFLKIGDKVVYPADQPNPALGNHLFLTPLVWSNDSKAVSFVDKNDSSLYLIAATSKGVTVNQKVPFYGDVRDLAWMGKRALRVQSAKHAWVYDLDQQTLKKVQ